VNTLRAASRGIRALMLLALLAAVIAGLPWGLWHFFGPPLPDHVPGYVEVKTWLDQAKVQPDHVAVQILDIAAWGYWALFTVQVAVQLPGVSVDTIRALRTRTPLPTAVHANLPGRLLATIAISIIAARGTVSTAVAASGDSSIVSATPGTVATVTTNAVLHVVVNGDSLWGIAEHHFGDPQRWKEIYELNRYRVQPDGKVLTDPDFIRPGWILTVPVGAVDASETSAPDDPVASAPSSRPLPQAQIPTPQPPAQAEQTAPTPSALPSPTPTSTPTAEVHQAPAVVRRPIAVHLPTGGYVSLTLGAGLAAALAAASVRSRVYARRRAPGEPRPETERLGKPEAALLQAAATLGYGRGTDPYVDEPGDGIPQIPRTLAPLRAPIAVYIGNRHGQPIPLRQVATGGLGLLGDGAHDAARALLASALSAGGFLAGSAVYQVVTTTEDLYTLTGTRLSGRVNDRLAVYDTLAEALIAIAASETERTAQRPLLVATASTATTLNTALAGDVEAVLLGCRDAATVAEVDSTGTIAASGAAAAILDEAQSYRLSQDEARALMDRMLAAAPAAEPELVAVPEIPAQTGHPTAPEPSAPTAPDAIGLPVPYPEQTAAAPPVPPQASGARRVAPEAALSINVLGPLQVKTADRDATALFRPLTAAILIQLALNPRGITRTTLAADLWPDLDLEPEARAKRFKATLSHVRTALAEACGTKADHIHEARPARFLTLNPDLITVDAWRFDQLLDTTRPTTGRQSPEHATGLLEAIGLHRGAIAHGHEHTDPKRVTDEAWLAPHREAYFHKLIDAHTDAATLLRPTDPDRAIDLVERAAELEPWNHTLSEQIIEIHAEQGHHHAAARRLAILTDHLAHLGMRPSPNIVALVGSVQVGAQ
jgi:DNA-binding SARP family transcriptional activator/LysM repeat protein